MDGDEWGLCEVMPAENLDHCRRVSGAFREQHKDTDFTSPYGFSTMPFVLPPAAVGIATRQIPVAELTSLFGGVLTKADAVDSCIDYTGTPFACPESFAFVVAFETSYWCREGFYGDQENGIVQHLFTTVTLCPAAGRQGAMIDAIVQLGRRFDLILFDAPTLIDLRNAEHVAWFVDRGSKLAE